MLNRNCNSLILKNPSPKNLNPYQHTHTQWYVLLEGIFCSTSFNCSGKLGAIHKPRGQFGGGRELAKWTFSKSDHGGEGVKSTQKFDHVVYGWPLRRACRTLGPMANYHKDHSVQTFELRILFAVQTGCSLHKAVS